MSIGSHRAEARRIISVGEKGKKNQDLKKKTRIEETWRGGELADYLEEGGVTMFYIYLYSHFRFKEYRVIRLLGN